MSTHKKIDSICIGVLIAVLVITVLFMNGGALGIETIIDEDADTASASGWYTKNDLNSSWDSSMATTVITLEGSSAKVVGKGAYFYDGDVVITNAGAYVFSGTLTDGSIVSSGTVRLTEAQWGEFFELLKDGTVVKRGGSADSGSRGPWLYLYWTGDKSQYQQFSFDSISTRRAFEDLCAELAQS